MTELPGHEAGLPYHASLVGDPHRVAAYERAIRQVVRPGSVVLDVGTGTGLLAIIAARCGARKVHAVESMPIHQAAQALVSANGVSDRVVIHNADVRSMAAIEPVDVIISDFMGRWVLDDQMVGAIRTAVERWLKPAGVVIPSHVKMLAAPVEISRFAALDVWTGSVAGVDLSPLAGRAMQQCYGAALGPDAVLSQPQVYKKLVTDHLDGLDWDETLTWTIQRAGHVRGLAGWFDAQLSNGVHLTTSPGIQTHWAQYLLPTPMMAVQTGDTLAARIRLVEGMWTWAGAVMRGGSVIHQFDHGQLDSQDLGALRISDRPLIPSLERAEAWNAEGSRRYEAGDYAGAAASFAKAVQHIPADGDEEFTRDVYENLGMMRYFEGRPNAAALALLRALDGDFSSREQSARFLVNACFAAGRQHDGARELKRYEEAFGSHPSQWQRVQRPAIGDPKKRCGSDKGE